MGCPTDVKLDESLAFSIATHDPDTGILTDADDLPIYRIYESDSDVELQSGDMAKQDDANTTGFYVKAIEVTVTNGFETGKSYTIQIEATVDGNRGGITFGFRVANDATLYDIAETMGLTKPGTESYAANGEIPTRDQFLFMILQLLQERGIAGTLQTVRKLDGATTAMTHRLNSASNPTDCTRES